MTAALALGASSATSLAGGRGIPPGPSRDWAYGAVIQPDGKIVAVGRTIDRRGRWRFGLMRFTRSGRVDARFGRNGRVATAFGTKGASAAAAVALERNGKLVVAGGVRGAGFAVGRYTARGRLDRTFGRGGKVTTAFRGYPTAKGVAVQPDGKPVVVGWGGLARYTARGRLDPSFGRGGKIAVGASAVVLQPDGKIVTAGSTGSRFAVTRYTHAGKLDTSFGQGGTALTAIGPGSSSRANAIAIQPDGKLVAAGDDDGYGNFVVVRFTPDGSLDPSFGSGGVVVTDFGERAGCLCDSSDESASAVAVQPDGKIVVAGGSDKGGKGNERSGSPLDDFALVRYEADGRLDRSFGRGGIVVSYLGEGWLIAEAVALQPDGAIVAVGGGAGSFVVARYRPDGQLDRTFGDLGQVAANIGT